MTEGIDGDNSFRAESLIWLPANSGEPLSPPSGGVTSRISGKPTPSSHLQSESSPRPLLHVLNSSLLLFPGTPVAHALDL